ncbi:hypothetical protein ACFOD1_00035 [Pseudidiomarina halophila]|uniref:hypothetical protein n=1 Tax=Pseudidiomarina halophila TaxID=1449799 RepID=UPI003614B785
MHDGGWDRSGRYFLTAANENDTIAVVDALERELEALIFKRAFEIMWLIRTTACALLFTAVFSTALFPSDTQAEPKIHDPLLNGGEQRELQRQLFVKAEYAAKRGRLNEYNQLLDELRGYPLLPYLELERLLQVGYVANEERVLEFFEVLDNTPLDWQLRYPWLDYLARNNEQQRFLRDFIYPGRLEHRCYFWRFSLQQGTQPEAAVMRAVDQLWLTGSRCRKPVTHCWRPGRKQGIVRKIKSGSGRSWQLKMVNIHYCHTWPVW